MQGAAKWLERRISPVAFWSPSASEPIRHKQKKGPGTGNYIRYFCAFSSLYLPEVCLLSGNARLLPAGSGKRSI